MNEEHRLKEKLRRMEALFAGTRVGGERAAAASALKRAIVLTMICGFLGGGAGCGSNGGPGTPDTGATDTAVDVVAMDAGDATAQEDRVTKQDPEIEAEVLAYPDPAGFHKVNSEVLVSAAQPYLMDEPFLYRTVEQLSDLDVRALSAAGGRIWAGTATGLHRLEPDQNVFVPVPLLAGEGEAVVDIAPVLDDLGRLILCQAHRVHWLDPDSGDGVSLELDDRILTAVGTDGTWTWTGSKAHGILGIHMGDTFIADDAVEELGDFEVRDLVVDSGGVTHFVSPNAYGNWNPETGVGVELSADAFPAGELAAVTIGPGGETFAGGTWGAALITGAGAQVVEAGLGGLPYDDVIALFAGKRLVMGHGIGATALEDPFSGEATHSRLDYYVSKRWLPDNRVQSVLADPEGRLWLGTPHGLTRVQWVSRTFEETALYFEEKQEALFWRMDGFVPSDIVADDPWNPVDWHHYDKDNDGLWTQMQIGAWCYAYAATGEERFYNKARKAMDVMMLQIDIPEVDFQDAGLGRGFVTRSLVRDDEGDLFAAKETQDNWHLVSWEDGHDYYWKDDTSSDEIDGHFYGYPLFYDLCAQSDDERSELALYVADMATYIVEHDYTLIDLDGEGTTHGHWEPDRMASAAFGLDVCMEWAGEQDDMFDAVAKCIGSWHGHGWVNSMQILGGLLATYHMTGNTFFYDEYRMLIDEHHYNLVVMPHEETLTLTDPAIMNHSDHELAMLAYHTLIRYEPDPDRRAEWIESLLYFYAWEQVERNPLWAAYVALLAGPEFADLEPALQSLREMPLDLREWLVDNSHRKDATPWPDDRHGDPQWEQVFPYDEIKTIWWNTNLHDMVGGGNGQSLAGPLVWLLPYWGMRYAGVIGE